MTIDRDTLDRAFRELAAAEPDVDLPAADHVYWRARVLARLARRSEAAERATRPVLWLQALAGSAVLVLLAGAAALLLTRLLGEGTELLLELPTGLDPGIVPVAAVAALSLLAAALLVGLQLAAKDG